MNTPRKKKAWEKFAEARRAREAGQVLPPPRTDGDPEFDALPIKVRTEINDALDWMLQMERSGSPHQTSQAIAKRYAGTDTEGRKNTGLSAGSIYRRFLAWREAGRDWRALEKYKTLRKGEAVPLQAYNLTPEAVHAYFTRQRCTLAQWAERNEFNVDAVSSAITGRRRTAMSQKILDMLAAEMRDEPGRWHQVVDALLKEAEELRSRVSDYERRLAFWKKHFPLWK